MGKNWENNGMEEIGLETSPYGCNVMSHLFTNKDTVIMMTLSPGARPPKFGQQHYLGRVILNVFFG